MKSKRGQNLPMNTIVIAALVLVVLVVLVMIFTGSIGGFTKGVQSCEDKGGICQPENYECKIVEGEMPIAGVTCPDEGVCCSKPIE